jgi:DNA-binding XRE family transcriptional regulator
MKQIKGYLNYLISVDGKVFNLKTMKHLKCSINNMGYPSVCLYNENGGKFFLVHRLMAEAFLPKKESKIYVNHIDGNKGNNLLSNLEWCTQKENCQHAWELGLNKTSEKNRENGKQTIKIAQKIGSKMRRKAIVDTSNGMKFEYCEDAAKYLGVRKETLTNWLNGHRANKTSLKYI